jgi:hypothetical protein
MSDVFTTVTWADLRCPTEPGQVEYQGMALQIKQSHIDAAEGELSARFAVLRFQPISGPASYNLGTRVN